MLQCNIFIQNIMHNFATILSAFLKFHCMLFAYHFGGWWEANSNWTQFTVLYFPVYFIESSSISSSKFILFAAWYLEIIHGRKIWLLHGENCSNAKGKYVISCFSIICNTLNKNWPKIARKHCKALYIEVPLKYPI